MLRGFGCEQLIPTEVWEDNAASIQIANNQVNHKFTRHIDTRRYYVLDLVRDKVMILVKCAGTHNVADQKPSWAGLDDASSLADWDTLQVQGVLRVYSVPWHHGDRDVGSGLGIRLA
eukprot:3840334-Rhodomonas_salina.1